MASVVELDAFPLKEHPLSFRAFGRQVRQTSVFSDDPVPWHILRADMESPAHLSGHARISGKKGHLSVADDLPGRNRADDVVDAFKEIHGIAEPGDGLPGPVRCFWTVKAPEVV